MATQERSTIMYNFDELVSRARDMAAFAGKKTEEIVDASKLKIKAAAIKNDIYKIHERIGGLVCQSAKSGEKFDDIINKLVKDAEDLEEELCDIEEQLNGEKGSKKCGFCGAYCPEDAQFCYHCGGSFSTKPSHEENMDENVVDVETEPADE